MTADEIGRILDELGERLGPAGERVFRLAIQWQVTAGIIGLLVSAVGLILIWLGLRYVWRITREGGGVDDMDRGMLRISAALGSAIGGGFLGTVLHDSALRLLNPEYAAIRDLLGRIGS